MMKIEKKKMNKAKRFKLSSINCVLIALAALIFSLMFVYYKQCVDNAVIHSLVQEKELVIRSLVQEKLLKIDYNNSYLNGVAIMLEDGYYELNTRVYVLESGVADIERRLKIIEKRMESANEFKRLK